MRIGIDARLVHETGVGRYIRHLLQSLAAQDTKHEFIVYTLAHKPLPFRLPKTWKEVHVHAKWHTLGEQIVLPLLYMRDRLDVLHVPYFTVPLFYPGIVVTTLHDLTILRVQTGKATTLPYPLYLIKKIAYRFVLEFGLKKSAFICCVSKTTAADAINTFTLNPKKLCVTYEGVDALFFQKTLKSPLSHPYYLYVGNAYPHKRLDVLEKAAQEIKRRIGAVKHPLFVFIGPQDYFYSQLKKRIIDKGLGDLFLFPNSIQDAELVSYYNHALAFVSPSQAEGFALPPLEALAADCPLIVSDIPVFRELLPQSTAFVPVGDELAWAQVLIERLGKKQVSPWSSKDAKEQFFSAFCWDVMAQKTLDCYEDAVAVNL